MEWYGYFTPVTRGWDGRWERHLPALVTDASWARIPASVLRRAVRRG